MGSNMIALGTVYWQCRLHTNKIKLLRRETYVKFEEASKADYFNDYGNRYGCNDDFPDAGYCYSAFSKKECFKFKEKSKKMSYPHCGKL